MPLIAEQDALALSQNIDSLPDQDRARALEVLGRYRDQQREFGLPDFPSQVAAESDRVARFRSMFDDLKKVDEAAPSIASILPYAENPDAERAHVANVAFLAHRYGQPTERIAQDYHLFRDDYAQRAKVKTGMDDLGFYAVAKGEVQKQKQSEDAANTAAQSAMTAALSGKGLIESLAEWQDKNKDAGDALPAFMAAYQQTAQSVAPHIPLVSQTMDAVTRVMDGKGTPEDEKTIADARERIVDMPGAERRQTLAAMTLEAQRLGLAATKDKSPEGGRSWTAVFTQQIGEAGGRLVKAGSSDIAAREQALASVKAAGEVKFNGDAILTAEDAQRYVKETVDKVINDSITSSASGPGGFATLPPDDRKTITLDANASKLVRDAVARAERSIRVSREMDSISNAADPIPSVYASTLGTSGAIMAVTALTRGASIPLMAQAYSNIEYNDLSLKYQQMSTADKSMIAGISGGIQALGDMVEFKALEHLPGLKSLITQPLTKTLAARALGRAAGSYVTENLVEAGQDIATPLLMKALKSDVPGFDWDAELKDFGRSRVDVMLGLLPLTLLGVGAASVNEYRGAKALLSDNARLGAAGVIEADRIKVLDLAAKGKLEEAQAALQEAWSKRDPAVAAEFQGQVDTKNAEAQQSFAEAVRIGLLPEIRRDGEGYTVTDGSNVAKFSTWEQARAMATAHMNEHEAANVDAIAAMADHFIATSPEGLKGRESIEIKPGKTSTLQDRVASGAMTIEEAAHAAVVAGQLQGMTEEESQRATFAVLGSNTVEQKENVRASVSKIMRGGNVLTAVEEPIEGRWKAGLASGIYTHESGVEWVRIAERATGEKFLPTSGEEITPRQLIEAISSIVVADVFGRRKDGTRLAHGAVTKGIKAATATQAEIKGFAAFLRAFRAFFSQVLRVANKLRAARKDGKLGADWEARMDDLLGIDSQQRHERAVGAEGHAMADWVDDSQFADSVFTPGPNDETFSLRAVPADTSKVTELPDGAKLVGPTSFSIRAYHGTPHKVDKFSLDKIGTGEGAQAYGWGLYFAESRDVAAGYYERLGPKMGGLTMDGKPAELNNPAHRAAAAVKDFGSRAKVIAQMEKTIDAWRKREQTPKVIEELKIFEATLQALQDTAKLPKVAPAGGVYTVELLPDESEFLDWDKPLSEQNEKVRNALLKGLPRTGILGEMLQPMEWGSTTGRAIYARASIEIKEDIQHPDLGPVPVKASIGDKGASKFLASLGIPGIKYLDGNSRDGGSGTRNFVIFDDRLVKILEENGKPVDESTSFSLRHSSLDELAASRGYNIPALHGTVDGGFTVFDPKKTPQKLPAIFFTDDAATARSYGGPAGITPAGSKGAGVWKVYLSLHNPLVYDFKGATWDGRTPDGKELGVTTNSLVEQAKAEGRDGAIFRNVRDEGPDGTGNAPPATVYAVFKPEQIKSADAFTGVPMEKRFNPNDSRITHSLRALRGNDRLAGELSARLKSPTQRIGFFTLAKERLAKLRADRMTWRFDLVEGTDSLAERDASMASLNNERQFRMRSEQRALIEKGMDGLTEATRLAYEHGLSKLEDHPLIQQMLRDNGRLMSLTTARKLGKNIDAEYNGAPWLPPSWYAKGTAGIMPDVMANNLGYAYPDQMWDAVRNVIASTQSINAEFKKARDAVRKIEADALTQAKDTANAWFNAAVANLPTPHEKMMASLRTLDAILSAFPAEVRGRVGGYTKLASLKGDKARLEYLSKRIEKIDSVVESVLKKELKAEVERLFKRYAPERDAGGKMKGKLGADTQTLVDAAEAAMDLDATKTAGRIADLEARIASGDLTPEQEILARSEVEMVQLFGDWRSADAARMNAAYDALENVASEGWAKWRLQRILKSEERDAAREALKADTGKDGTKRERSDKALQDAGLLGKLKDKMLSISSFPEVVRYVFGTKSKEGIALVDSERQASNQYEDAVQSLGDEVADFFANLAGGSHLKGEQLRFELSRPTIDAGTEHLSPLQAIQALLIWQQEDGKRHMEGPRDEDNKPIPGKWAYDQAWIDNVTSQLTPEAVQVMTFIQSRYAAEWATLNPLYRERHGVNLPHHDNYAPITVKPQQAKLGEMIDPVSGQPMSGSILTPGALRTRSRSAIAEPRFEDALQTMIAHTKQMEHWKAYYDFAVDAQAILGNRELSNAVEAAGGKEAAKVLKQWVEVFAQGGVRDAGAGLAVNRAWGKIVSRASGVAVLGRVSTLLVQSTQLGAAMVEMPTMSYLNRFGRLMTGNLGWGDAVRSDFIQRRYKTAPPIVRQALQSLGDAKKPNAITHGVRFLGEALSGADALFTSGTYAILLDYHRGTGAAIGLSGAELEAHAHAEAERATERVAQPVRTGNRSLAEITATNPMMRAVWAFASEARQKLSLMAWAGGSGDWSRASKAAFLAIIVGGLMPQIIKNLWRDAKGDDDDDKWSAKRLTLGVLTNVAQGAPGASMMAGEKSLLALSPSRLEKAVETLSDPSGAHIADMAKAIETLLTGMGNFNDTAAALASFSHILTDAAKVGENVTE